MVLKNVVIYMFQYWGKGLLSTTSSVTLIYEMRCVIWYHLYNLKNIKNDPGEMLLLVTLLNYANGTKLRNAPHILFGLGGRSIVRFAEFYKSYESEFFKKDSKWAQNDVFQVFIKKRYEISLILRMKLLWQKVSTLFWSFGVNGAQNRFF